MYLNKGIQNECFTGKFPKIFTKATFFEMIVMDGCSKNSNNFFHKTPMNTSGWMKKDNKEKVVIVAKSYWCQITEHKSWSQ